MAFPEQQPTAPSAEKIRQIFHHCFEVDHISSGDVIPVGSSDSRVMDLRVEADLEHFSGFFTEALSAYTNLDHEKFQKYLESNKVEVPENLFSAAFAFSKTFAQTYPEIADDHTKLSERSKLYNKANITLSEVFEAKRAACAEIAVLAQVYFQKAGFSSSYFSGDVLWERDWEFSEQHTFIVLRHEGKQYVYDPSNPTRTPSSMVPSFYLSDKDFDQEVRRGHKRFVTMQNAVSKKEAWYGTNDQTNIRPQDIV